MTINHLFLMHRYKAMSVHYVSPTDDNRYQTQKMKTHGLFSEVHDEVGQVIVATVDTARVQELVQPDSDALGRLTRRETAGDRVLKRIRISAALDSQRSTPTHRALELRSPLPDGQNAHNGQASAATARDRIGRRRLQAC